MSKFKKIVLLTAAALGMASARPKPDAPDPHLTARMEYLVRGRVHWEHLDVDGTVLQEGEHDNLILNAGLDNLMTTQWGSYFSTGTDKYPNVTLWRLAMALGTGSTAPAETQTNLVAEVARSNTNDGFASEQFTSWANNASTIVMTSYHVRVVTFAASYNITEYGFGPSATANSALSIRGLFLDNGTPVAISVQSGQKIKVTHAFILTLQKVFTDVTVNMTNYGNITGKQSFYFVSQTSMDDFATNMLDPTKVGSFLYYLTAADTFNVNAAPTANNTNTGSSVVSSYVAGSYSRTRTHTFDTAHANGNFYGFTVGAFGFSNWGWRFGLTNPAFLVKDSTRRFTFSVTMTIARG